MDLREIIWMGLGLIPSHDKTWTEIISQEMPTVHEASDIHRKCIPHKWFNHFNSPLQSRIEAIQKLQPPTNVKG